MYELKVRTQAPPSLISIGNNYIHGGLVGLIVSHYEVNDEHIIYLLIAEEENEIVRVLNQSYRFNISYDHEGNPGHASWELLKD